MPPSPNISVDLGGTHLRVAVVVGRDVVALEQRRVVDLLEAGAPGGVLPGLLHLIDELRRQHPATQGRTIGLGIAAAVDAHGAVREPLPPGVPGGRALRDAIERSTGSAVVADNDANMAALGEGCYGAARGVDDFSLITLGTNLGMGIVIAGEVYRGVTGAAGELGMLPLPAALLDAERLSTIVSSRAADGHPPHGHVWLEELYGGRALTREYRRRASSGAAVATAGVKVLESARDGDALAQQITQDATAGWALSIAIVCGLFDPALILIGGGISADLGPFVEPLRREVAALTPTPPAIELASLGPDAGLIGAAAAAARSDD